MGSLPFFLVLVLFAGFLGKHMDWVWSSIAVTSAVWAASIVRKMLKDGAVKEASEAFHAFLTRPRVAGGLWVGTLMLGAASLFVSSVHVNAEKPQPVWLYWMEETADASGSPRKVDSIFLDRVTPHGGLIMPRAMSRRGWFLSSTYLRSEPIDLGPWSGPTLAYPERFDTVVTVALLPVPRLLGFIGDGRPLRVRVRNDQGTLIAEDSLVDRHRMPSLLLSVVEAPRPDDAMGARWRQRLASQARTPADADRAQAFLDWSLEYKWVRARQPLAQGQKLVVQVVSADGRTVVDQSVPIKHRYTDAILLQSRP